MSISAEKEKRMEDEIAGLKGKSKAFWADRFMAEFALMARKLRRSAVDEKGNKVAADLYSPIIERQLAKMDAAIKLLEKNPQLALEYGESGKGVEEILELIERKAAEIEADAQFKDAAEDVRKLLPGARVNAVVRQARKVGGLINAQGAFTDAIFGA